MADDASSSAVPITNTLFPPPPPYYKEYTDIHVERYEQLLANPLSSSTLTRQDGESNAISIELDEDEQAELRSLEEKLGKPRFDWVEEDGRWMAFGQMYNTKPIIPTAQSIGLPQFFDPSAQPQETLPKLLHSFLHTLLLLLDTLTNTARTPDELAAAGWAHEGDQYIQHLTNLSAHMMVSSNQLRGVQSESTLVLMMEKELEERRRQTKIVRDKCREIAGSIAAFRTGRSQIPMTSE